MVASRPRVVTLLIDNYDSYTYNLYQMLAQVNGIAPLVLTNDAFGSGPDGWAAAWQALLAHGRTLLADDEAREFNVVISPGPGHPAVPKDFGLCAAAIQGANDLPVLGVCLGHQGLAHVHGGSVVKAPEAMHGRTSQVFYTTSSTSDEEVSKPAAKASPSPLFAHIPDGFEVVRYHSLVVAEQDLPASLRVNARTQDGVIMALQHESKPQFGVQFHPEAVCSTFGYQLLQNFRDLTLREPSSKCLLHHSDHQQGSLLNGNASAVTQDQQVMSTAAEYHVQVQVASVALASLDFARYVFHEFFGCSQRSFWLDSSNFTTSPSPASLQQSNAAPQSSRFSLMGDNSGPLSECVEFSVADNLLRVHSTRENATTERRDLDVLSYLRLKMQQFSAHDLSVLPNAHAADVNKAADLPFAFRGGYVGYFGYELLGSHDADDGVAASTSSTCQRNDAAPDASFLFADRALVFDHALGRVYSLSVATDPVAAHQWHAQVMARLERAVRTFQSQAEGFTASVSSTAEELVDHVVFSPSRSRDQYVRDIVEVQRLINEGETYEVCLTNQLRAQHFIKNPLRFYDVLRKRNPAPYAGFYLSNPRNVFQSGQSAGETTPLAPADANASSMVDSYAICSSSPERFLRVGQDGWMESKPIKGTRRRGQTSAEDAAIAAELATCAKDRAENMMIADLVRNDFGRVAQIGSVYVPTLMNVESYATVHQLVTTVRGRRRDDADLVDILHATFPGGSMTGAPKKRTMQIIRRLEQGPRGVYSGALGFLSLDGSCDLNIIIRTAVITPSSVSLGSGGAIIALSDTDDEYDEMLLKTRALVSAIGFFATSQDEGASVKTSVEEQK